jgi:hypothetical protein
MDVLRIKTGVKSFLFIYILLTISTIKPVFSQSSEYSGRGFNDFAAAKEYHVTEMTGDVLQEMINRAHENKGGTVIIQAGVIEIYKDINLRSNVKLKGTLNSDGSLATTIKAKEKLYQALLVARKDTVQNTTVENLIIDGGGFDHHGLSFIYGTDNFLVSNCKIINIGLEKVPCHPKAHRAGSPTAINMWSGGDEYTDNFTIVGNRAISVALHGINVNNGRNFIIKDNYLKKCFMGWDASTGSKNGEIVGNEVVDCTFGAKTHGGRELIIHENNHHNLDDRSYYYDGKWENNSGTAFAIQGPGVKAKINNNRFSGVTAEKGIAWWGQEKKGIELENNDTLPSKSLSAKK